jgi:putative two-component system hydrogenase maturation factor HypX/HoxX
MQCLHEALRKIAQGEEALPLDYDDLSVRGRLHPNMKIPDRTFDFNRSADEVARAIWLSDSAPGAPCEIQSHKVVAYNAHVNNDPSSPHAAPGTITGKLQGAVRIACAEGSVWVTHMKVRGKGSVLPSIKLPATDILPRDLLSNIQQLPNPGVFSNPNESPYVECRLVGDR